MISGRLPGTIAAAALCAEQLPANASITVEVGGKGVSVTAYAAAIKCTKFDPYLGNEAYLRSALAASSTRR